MKKALVASALVCGLVCSAGAARADDLKSGGDLKMPSVNLSGVFSAKPASQTNVSPQANVSAQKAGPGPMVDLGKAYNDLAGGAAAAYNTAAGFAGGVNNAVMSRTGVNPAQMMGNAVAVTAMVINPAMGVPVAATINVLNSATVNAGSDAGAVSQMKEIKGEKTLVAITPTGKSGGADFTAKTIESAPAVPAASAPAASALTVVSGDPVTVVIPVNVPLTAGQQKGMDARSERYGSQGNIRDVSDLNPAQKAALDRVLANAPVQAPAATGSVVQAQAPAAKPTITIAAPDGGTTTYDVTILGVANPGSSANGQSQTQNINSFTNIKMPVMNPAAQNVSPTSSGMGGLERVINQVDGKKLID